MDVVGIVVDVVTVSAIVLIFFRSRKSIAELEDRQTSTQAQWKDGYEKTNRRISDHIQSRMHEDR